MNMFSGTVPQLELPLSESLEDNTDESGDQINFEIESSVVKGLYAGNGDAGINSFSALYSVFFLFMNQLTGQDDLVIGTMSSGRLQQGLEPLVGMFARTLPVRYQVDAKQSFHELLKSVSKVLVEVQAHQMYDLADILIEVNKNKAVSDTKLFDVMFVYQNFDKGRLELKDTGFAYYEFENKTTKYPLSLVVSESNDVFKCRMEYASRYFSVTDIENLIAHFKKLAIAISENPDRELIDLVGDAEQSPEYIANDISFNI